jgi:hypothetical protein
VIYLWKCRSKLISLLIVAVVTAGAMHTPSSQAQTEKQRQELFTSYVSGLPFQVHIPAATCATIISQADRIVSTVEGFKGPNQHDLQVGSLNLRSCATSPERDLARIDRDLAVGLYGEVVSELERRERGKN